MYNIRKNIVKVFMHTIPHIPVLYKQVLNFFSDIKSGVVIDCTMGYGGHSSMILEANPNIKLIGIDQDETAVEFCTNRLDPYKDRVDIKKGRFSSVIKDILKEHDVREIKGILADIGVSSLQLDEKDRGFSFSSDNLDMRMDKESALSAADVVNTYAPQDLERILLEYAELRNYKKIASFIVGNRPFSSAKELSEATKHLMPKGKKIHPSTLLMQAIRIEVNNELGELNSLLDTIEEARFPNAKIAIISFHSLEDRIVKNKFNEWKQNCICPKDAIRCTCSNNNSYGIVLTKKPITAEDEELGVNPRSRSAKLRVFETDNANE